ncbi:hypothetical protein [Pseudodonghicola xiamenensis]|uniref:Uncharacterized protein n=1 Tax=Pseudodonghicola xiamenensis TaxID=337702 RepID=A0A8J3H5T5_9RHOB|nr:hypothetical protein [Pseudodonghicola xiamenensis]GHG82919.1 hypothetical protein GCM10010961_07840 [Pseudodonghicola xiamenensis]
MKRIELLKTLALVFFIVIGAVASHAASHDAEIARADQPCSQTVMFVTARPDAQAYTLPRSHLS